MTDALNDNRVELLGKKEVAICYGASKNTNWRCIKRGKLQKDTAGRSQIIVKHMIEEKN